MTQVHLCLRRRETKARTWADAMLLLDVWRRTPASRALLLADLGAEELSNIVAELLRGVTKKQIK